MDKGAINFFNEIVSFILEINCVNLKCDLYIFNNLRNCSDASINMKSLSGSTTWTVWLVGRSLHTYCPIIWAFSGRVSIHIFGVNLFRLHYKGQQYLKAFKWFHNLRPLVSQSWALMYLMIWKHLLRFYLNVSHGSGAAIQQSYPSLNKSEDKYWQSY